MKILVTEKFLKSLKRMHMEENSKLYKIWCFLRYDIKWFLKNLKTFRKDIYKFRPWQWQENLQIFKTSLEKTLICISNGDETPETLIPIVKSIKKAIIYLDVIINERYREIAEVNTGLKYIYSDDNIVYDSVSDSWYYEPKYTPDQLKNNELLRTESQRIEKEYWNYIWDTIKGCEEIKGSDLRNWWR
jgi:hypothetical protein